jgi:hypothetical protein
VHSLHSETDSWILYWKKLDITAGGPTNALIAERGRQCGSSFLLMSIFSEEDDFLDCVDTEAESLVPSIQSVKNNIQLTKG